MAEFTNLISSLLFGTAQAVMWQMRANAYLSHNKCYDAFIQIII